MISDFKWIICGIFCMAIMVSCSGENSIDSEYFDSDTTLVITDTDTDTDSDTDKDTDTDTDIDTDTDTDTDTDSDTITGTDTIIDTGTNNSLVIEDGEDGFCFVEGIIETKNSGYSGTGYANTDNVTGAGIEWAVVSAAGGTASLTWNYASISDRPADLIINDISAGSVEFSSTGDWTYWETSTITVSLAAGNNIIRLESVTGDGLANIDNLTIEGAGIAAGSCDGSIDSDTGVDTGSDTGNDTGSDTYITECTPGEKECVDSNTPRVCDNSGYWSVQPDCQYVCLNGVCNTETTGIIRITDTVPGWASIPVSGLSNGTTGGGQNLSSA
ncbi:MAG: carbohydrate-binding protein, partial [Deltaproteobacteria bacterium]|nr:carbohydrate-binding protein [Deltaproteobacteria bacterium]